MPDYAQGPEIVELPRPTLLAKKSSNGLSIHDEEMICVIYNELNDNFIDAREEAMKPAENML